MPETCLVIVVSHFQKTAPEIRHPDYGETTAVLLYHLKDHLFST
jgi:hypothetical protein